MAMFPVHQFRMWYQPNGHPRIDLRSFDDNHNVSVNVPSLQDAQTVVKSLMHNNTIHFHPERNVVVATNIVFSPDNNLLDNNLSSPQPFPTKMSPSLFIQIPNTLGAPPKQVPNGIRPRAKRVDDPWDKGLLILGYNAGVYGKKLVLPYASPSTVEPGSWNFLTNLPNSPISYNVAVDLGIYGLHWLAQQPNEFAPSELRLILWTLRHLSPLWYQPNKVGFSNEWQNVGTIAPTYPGVLLKQKIQTGSQSQKSPGSLSGQLTGSTVKTMPDLNAWLNQHPQIAESIVLEHDGGPTAYTDWTKFGLQKYKQMLLDAFAATWWGKPWTWDDPPPNDGIVTTVSSELGEKIYFAYVAHCLATELRADVAWSLTTYPPQWTQILLYSKNIFHWAPQDKTYKTANSFQNYQITPGLPQETFSFLKSKKILRSTQFATVVKLIDWSRQHMQHTQLGLDKNALLSYWGYAGSPPVSKILAGTVGGPPGAAPKFSHYIIGCRNMLGFLHTVLKTVNIPVQDPTDTGLFHTTAHIRVHFPSLGRFLAHADDAFLKLASIPPVPSWFMLMNWPEYFANFGIETVTFDTAAKNIGKIHANATVKYIPLELMQLVCGLSVNSIAELVTSGALDSALIPLFSVQDLDEMFNKAKWKIQAFGGSGVVGQLMLFEKDFNKYLE